MSDVTTALFELFLLVLVALVPALLYLAWIRRSERFEMLGWGPLLGTFVYGAVIATIIAAILEAVIVGLGTAVSQAYPGPEFLFLNGNSSLGAFFLVLVIAPFVEEGLKATGVTRVGPQLRLVSDGLVFGAAAGLGFGFFETFLYGFGAFATGGLAAGIILILVRSVSSVVLHGSTTSMFGYGYAASRLQKRSGAAGGYYLLAVLMHSTFNLLASLGAILAFLGFGSGYVDLAGFLSLFVAIGFAFGAIEHARSVIQATDFPGAAAVHPNFRPPPVRRTPPTR
ncbi:MAG TPA: PrsW family glutamic-type intramembrane protease [Thermoplasmata archaeon]|nr:PrsW family glutamic-type intramembrane protease [Thermoplasmata archaeon]